MRFENVIDLHVPGDTVRKDPRFWDRLKTLFGGKERDDARMQGQLTTAHLVQGAKSALEAVGITNAVALVVDGSVLFEDPGGRSDDFADLFVSFFRSDAAAERDLKDMQLTVEHVEDGLHLVVEVIGIAGRGEAARDVAHAQVKVVGEIVELRRFPDEPLELLRERTDSLLATPSFTDAHRLAFEGFVERVRNALGAALPEVRVTRHEPQARAEAAGAKQRKASGPEPLTEVDSEAADADKWAPDDGAGDW